MITNVSPTFYGSWCMMCSHRYTWVTGEGTVTHEPGDPSNKVTHSTHWPMTRWPISYCGPEQPEPILKCYTKFCNGVKLTPVNCVFNFICFVAGFRRRQICTLSSRWVVSQHVWMTIYTHFRLLYSVDVKQTFFRFFILVTFFYIFYISNFFKNENVK